MTDDTNRPAVGVPLDEPVGPDPERAAFEAWFLDRYSYSRAVLTNPIWAREIADAAEAFMAGQAAERERLANAADLVRSAHFELKRYEYSNATVKLSRAVAALPDGPN
jgi:hypothetical protein